MRILYGVVGEGMGHAMRSGVVLDHLTRNHEVQVVVSGRAHDYLVKRASERLSVRKIWGLNIVYEDNEVSNFRTERAQRAARFSSLMGHVLFSERSQFIQKISALEQIVEELGDLFVEAVGQASLADSEARCVSWQALDASHFDLNTSLRETLVLLKSFLVVLPEEQLDLLDFTIRGLCRTRTTLHSAAAGIRARRIAAVAGK